jgi:poly(3-hydroxybutyrate) depolymerase
MRKRKGHGKKLSYYEFGATALFACQYDQRFSYCLYVPEEYSEDGDETYPLVVLIHGSNRTAQEYRDRFADFAEEHHCFVMAPLFPCGIEEPGELHNYKYIKFHDIRFDLVLLSMIDEITAKYRLESERFLLHGFSGGGHFAHRFFYLHPHRLMAVSIGAPGAVTLLDTGRKWWPGVADVEEEFGLSLDFGAMRQVPVQMVIGADDTDTWEINDPGRPGVVRGEVTVGTNRLERLQALRESFESHGIEVRHDLVPGATHEGYKLLPATQTFFADVLTKEREGRSPLTRLA